MERSTLKRELSCPDLESAKAMRSTLILQPQAGSPMLMLSAEKDGCRVYNPVDDTVYETKSGLSGYRFLGSSGKWFLVVDSRLKLYIIYVFSEERIDLPPLESFKGSFLRFERVGENKVMHNTLINDLTTAPARAEDLRGRLWVDDKNGDYVVVWQFEKHEYLGFCKNGDDHYCEILTRDGVRRELRDVRDMVLKGYNLYIFATREFIRHLDLSGKDGFKDVSENHRFPMWKPPLSMDERERINQNKIFSSNQSVAVTRSGEVLLVYTYEVTSSRHRMFHLYKRDPKDLDPKTYDTRLVEVHSLGDEALFLDLGTTVPADHTLCIEPNSIYFTRGDRIHHKRISSLDICVFNLTTKTIKRFPSLSNLNVKDAQWFLPS